MECGRGWRERTHRTGTARREGRGRHRSRPGGLRPAGPQLPRDRDRTVLGRAPAGEHAAVAGAGRRLRAPYLFPDRAALRFIVAFTWLWDHLTFQRGARFKAAVWGGEGFHKARLRRAAVARGLGEEFLAVPAEMPAANLAVDFCS